MSTIIFCHVLGCRWNLKSKCRCNILEVIKDDDGKPVVICDYNMHP